MSDMSDLKMNKCDYKCETCPRWFHTKKGLEHHNERIHGDSE